MNAIATSACQLEELRLEIMDELRGAIAFDRFCMLLADPDTLMEHRGLGGNDWRSEVPALSLNTGQQADVNSLAVLIRKRDPVGSLRAATDGDPAHSQRWRDVYSRYGVGNELRTVVVDRHGWWGEVFMFRSSDERPFGADDVELMSAASSIMARTLQAGQVAPMRRRSDAPQRSECCPWTMICA